MIINTSKAPPLLPCSFCGGDWVLPMPVFGPRGGVCCECQNCKAKGPEVDSNKNAEAFHAWNRRISETGAKILKKLKDA